MPEQSNKQTLTFVVAICLICAVLLSLLATGLEGKQKEAKNLYQNKQLLVAARLIDFDTTLSGEDVLKLYDSRVKAMLTDKNGNLMTFKDVGLDEESYIRENESLGYADLTYKLLYVVSSDDGTPLPYGYVFPINGYGLWDAIYGYLCLGSDADTIIGTTWYDQKETPGLGAEIATQEWQEQFSDKVIFQKSPSGTTNFARAPLGIKVVGNVQEEFGTSPLGENAVDAITGATRTMEGVTDAYRNTLTPYRPFLIRAHDKYLESQ